MRLINEDDVLRIVERVTNEAVEKKQPKYLIQSRIIAEIAGLPTIEAEPVNGWISVKDRLPEIGEHYRSKLVMCYTPDGEHEYLFDYYEVNGFGQGCFTAEKYFGISITHWQYLPEPPKEE